MLLVMGLLGIFYVLLLARVTDLALLQGTLQRYADNNIIEQVEDVGANGHRAGEKGRYC